MNHASWKNHYVREINRAFVAKSPPLLATCNDSCLHHTKQRTLDQRAKTDYASATIGLVILSPSGDTLYFDSESRGALGLANATDLFDLPH